jgi:bifunctional non-homologous end joining protein LigD
MALEEYRKKRDFRRTPEPAGSRRRPGKAAAPLAFVVQKHRARRLHYDFRLELGGVLLSWAIPKGPSLDPGEKRLAVHVEDHPVEYGAFEGVIPEGQYGGGTVMLWDRGTWTPEDADPAAAYKKGALKFRLDGEKLHGAWALVRMGGKAAREGRDNWLLIKERDGEARPGSAAALVADQPLSVASGRSLAAIAADRDRVWDIARGGITADPKTAAPPPGARQRAMPERVSAQLAAPAAEPPAGDSWLHEIKYDGYRLLARIAEGNVRLLTRNGLDWTGRFPSLARAFSALPAGSALIDGEVVALAADGTTSFARLQDALARGDTADLVYFAFDLLYRNGWDLTGAALEDRKAALAALVPPAAEGVLRYSDHQEGRGPDFFRLACAHRLEGIVAKRRDRPYRAGRSSDWLKVKCHKQDEFVVIGFTEPSGRRLGFGALLLGYHDAEGTLRYAGRVGTGFSDRLLAELRPRLDRMARREAPAALPKGASQKGVHWVEPRLVAEVRYAEWTADGVLRQPAFLGLREDKSPEEVVYPPPAGDGRADPSAGRTRREDEGQTAPAPARGGGVRFAGVRLSHPDRVLYPEEGITKLALAQYYERVKEWALPHLAHRALSLLRCPAGHHKHCFYQKHLSAGVPDVVGRVAIVEKSVSGTYLVVEDLAGLVAMVQLGVLEIHPWGSTVDRLETPDRITFDFDPDEGLSWSAVTAAALEMRAALQRVGLESFVKTTGGKGLHVVVPVAPKLGWDRVKEFARWVAERFVAEYPERFTANPAKRARAGRIFIDYLRNGRGATAIGAYSPRARPGAPVATPLFWEEVERGVRPSEFTVLTVPKRLARLNSDPWAGMATLRQAIGARVRRAAGI